MRKEQQKNKQAPRYDKKCKSLSAAEIEENLKDNKPYVVRLAVPEEGSISFKDVVRGELKFELKDIDDQVLVKSDGFPTYHLAVIVDDHLMEITHIIRGEEWIPSTPKHALLYEAFGFQKPEFVHMPVLLSKEGGKMSKRHGETSLLKFRDNGYSAEAVVNFMALLGWNPKTEEEFFSMEQLIEKFDLSMINSANPIFETTKLDWMNQQYMRKLTPQEIIAKIEELAEVVEEGEQKEMYTKFIQWFRPQNNELQDSIWESLQERANTLLDVAKTVLITEGKDLEYQVKDLIWKKSDKGTTITILKTLIEYLENIPEGEYLSKNLESKVIPWIKEETEWGNGDVLWPMRFALSGQQKSPSPFELAEILQKEEALSRLNYALELLQK